MEEREFKTTFFDDFTIADKFWNKAIEDTFIRAFAEWNKDYRYLTELVIALNRKLWEWHEKDEERAELYESLWEQADNFAMKHLKDEELKYFLRQTD